MTAADRVPESGPAPEPTPAPASAPPSVQESPPTGKGPVIIVCIALLAIFIEAAFIVIAGLGIENATAAGNAGSSSVNQLPPWDGSSIVPARANPLPPDPRLNDTGGRVSTDPPSEPGAWPDSEPIDVALAWRTYDAETRLVEIEILAKTAGGYKLRGATVEVAFPAEFVTASSLKRTPTTFALGWTATATGGHLTVDSRPAVILHKGGVPLATLILTVAPGAEFAQFPMAATFVTIDPERATRGTTARLVPATGFTTPE